MQKKSEGFSKIYNLFYKKQTLETDYVETEFKERSFYSRLDGRLKFNPHPGHNHSAISLLLRCIFVCLK